MEISIDVMRRLMFLRFQYIFHGCPFLLKLGYAFDSSDDFVWLNEKVRKRDLWHIERQTRDKQTDRQIMNRNRRDKHEEEMPS
jgi:hypothetical protein